MTAGDASGRNERGRAPDVRRREPTRLGTWKATTPGMWAWLAQRLAAIALVPLIVAHVLTPYKVATQVALLTLVVFHGLLGVRVLLIELGVGARHEKTILAIVGVAAAALLYALGGRVL